MAIEEFEGVDRDKIIEGKVNQYKLALNKLERAAGLGNAYGFLKAGNEFLELKDEVEEHLTHNGGAYKGLEEVSNYQKRFLRIFQETIQHNVWSYGRVD